MSKLDVYVCSNASHQQWRSKTLPNPAMLTGFIVLHSLRSVVVSPIDAYETRQLSKNDAA